MNDDHKVNEREGLLISTYGAAEAVRSAMATIGQRFQPAALNNQFVTTDLTAEEIEEIRSGFDEGVLAMSKVMDMVENFVRDGKEE